MHPGLTGPHALMYATSPWLMSRTNDVVIRIGCHVKNPCAKEKQGAGAGGEAGGRPLDGRGGRSSRGREPVAGLLVLLAHEAGGQDQGQDCGQPNAHAGNLQQNVNDDHCSSSVPDLQGQLVPCFSASAEPAGMA